MKYFIIIVIKTYQLYFPKKYRGCCLYKESCSNFVLRITKTKGCLAGLKAFKYRWGNCRPNYSIIKKKKTLLLITDKYNIIEEKNLDPRIITQNSHKYY